jgi:hypothetical protein
MSAHTISPVATDVYRSGADPGHTPVAVIARRTHLSAGTVRNHLAAAVTELGVTTRAEAFRIAHHNGWL